MTLTEPDAKAIIAAQMPLTEKIRRADHVVWNNGPREVLAAQAKLLLGLWRI
jgi:dephospho-CoA kinase